MAGTKVEEKGKPVTRRNFKADSYVRKHRESIHPSTVGMIDQVNLVRHGSCHRYIYIYTQDFNPFPVPRAKSIRPLSPWWIVDGISVQRRKPLLVVRARYVILLLLVYSLATKYVAYRWVDRNNRNPMMNVGNFGYSFRIEFIIGEIIY